MFDVFSAKLDHSRQDLSEYFFNTSLLLTLYIKYQIKPVSVIMISLT